MLVSCAKKKAVKYSIFPVYLLMPLAISVGYGVILPVASPSNAILYTSGYLTIKDMVINTIIFDIKLIIIQ
jgi:sodium-dependent dicarboxylate transporter 2/3/5